MARKSFEPERPRMFSFLPEVVPSIWVALVLVTAFALTCAKPLREHPLPFYLFFTVMEVLYVNNVLEFSVPLHDLNQLFSSCYTGVAMYLVVMFAGAFDRRKPWVKRLLSVRSELSIIAGIVIVGHSVLVAVLPVLAVTGLWTRIWGAAAGVMFLACVAVGLPLLVCFLVPWITSFKFVRNRLDYATWKKTQKFAYPFMALLILQGILLSVGHGIYRFQDTGGAGDLTGFILNGATYLAIGVAYLVLKVRETRRRAARRLASKQLLSAPCVESSVCKPTTKGDEHGTHEDGQGGEVCDGRSGRA